MNVFTASPGGLKSNVRGLAECQGTGRVGFSPWLSFSFALRGLVLCVCFILISTSFKTKFSFAFIFILFERHTKTEKDFSNVQSHQEGLDQAPSWRQTCHAAFPHVAKYLAASPGAPQQEAGRASAPRALKEPTRHVCLPHTTATLNASPFSSVHVNHQICGCGPTLMLILSLKARF